MTIDAAFGDAYSAWCAAAACMADQPGKTRAQRCEETANGLATGVGPDGAPVFPLPDPFCAAFEGLSASLCLCASPEDPSTPAMAALAPDLAVLADNAGFLGQMCGTAPNTGTQGACAQAPAQNATTTEGE